MSGHHEEPGLHGQSIPDSSVPVEWHGTAEEQAPVHNPSIGTRRSFLFKLAIGINGLIGMIFAAPILGYIVGPALRKDSDNKRWINLGSTSQFPLGQTRLAEYVAPVVAPNDGDTAKTVCWVRHAEDGKFQVFAINCAHLGCPVRWFEQSKLFLCPCHGGAYYADGSRASGPPERGLFEHELKVEGGNLLILAGQLPTITTTACKGSEPKLKGSEGFVDSNSLTAGNQGGTTWRG